MLGWNAHLCVAFRADGSLAELAGHSARSKHTELRAKTEETELPFLNVLLDLNAHRETLQLSLRDHRANVHDFLECQRETVVLELLLPLSLVE